jgi:hypothetical protein
MNLISLNVNLAKVWLDLQAWARLEVQQDPSKARSLMEAAVKAEPFNLKLWDSYDQLERLISGEGSAQVRLQQCMQSCSCLSSVVFLVLPANALQLVPQTLALVTFSTFCYPKLKHIELSYPSRSLSQSP